MPGLCLLHSWPAGGSMSCCRPLRHACWASILPHLAVLTTLPHPRTRLPHSPAAGTQAGRRARGSRAGGAAALHPSGGRPPSHCHSHCHGHCHDAGGGDQPAAGGHCGSHRCSGAAAQERQEGAAGPGRPLIPRRLAEAARQPRLQLGSCGCSSSSGDCSSHSRRRQFCGSSFFLLGTPHSHIQLNRCGPILPAASFPPLNCSFIPVLFCPA